MYLLDQLYKAARPQIFEEDPEAAHRKAIELGKKLNNPFARFLIELFLVRDQPRLYTSAFGINFDNPVGLAAGFDKHAELVDFLPTLGFGFIEVGTVTPKPQSGNEKPRVFRLPNDHALINRLGFNSDGLEIVKDRLQFRRSYTIPLGVNIGKNKDTPQERAIDDYVQGVAAFHTLADYITINVSSPNTPGLRGFQDKEPLKELIYRSQAKNTSRIPILIKIAPDLDSRALDDIVEVAKETKISGIIATNTTTSRDGLKTDLARVSEIGAGGLSGDPLRHQSNVVIRHLYRSLRKEIPIIGVGGIRSAEDAYEKMCAGATLVQVYTGLIYQGPGLVHTINKGLLRCLDRDGIESIENAVGIRANGKFERRPPLGNGYTRGRKRK